MLWESLNIKISLKVNPCFYPFNVIDNKKIKHVHTCFIYFPPNQRFLITNHLPRVIRLPISLAHTTFFFFLLIFILNNTVTFLLFRPLTFFLFLMSTPYKHIQSADCFFLPRFFSKTNFIRTILFSFFSNIVYTYFSPSSIQSFFSSLSLSLYFNRQITPPNCSI